MGGLRVRGIQLTHVSIDSGAKTPTRLVRADTITLELLDASGQVLAHHYETSRDGQGSARLAAVLQGRASDPDWPESFLSGNQQLTCEFPSPTTGVSVKDSRRRAGQTGCSVFCIHPLF